MTNISTFLLNNPDLRAYTMSDGVVREDKNVDLQVALDLAKDAPFWAERGKAIEAYAQLEHSLCRLFAYCGDITDDTAVTVFFKMTNTGARSGTIEKLLHAKFGNEYKLYWNSYLKQLRQIDVSRNEIVHWTAAVNVALNQDSQIVVGVNLVHPSLKPQKNSARFISTDDLVEFQAKCSVYARLITFFLGQFNSTLSHDPAWQDIFRQPLVYPLPEAHPLNRPSPEPR